MIMFFKCCKFNVYILKYDKQIMLLRNKIISFVLFKIKPFCTFLVLIKINSFTMKAFLENLSNRRRKWCQINEWEYRVRNLILIWSLYLGHNWPKAFANNKWINNKVSKSFKVYWPWHNFIFSPIFD
jgi:hypothetical protein